MLQVKELPGAGESMWMVQMKVLEMTSLLVEMASFLFEKTSLCCTMTSFQMLSPLRERFFTLFYNALRGLNLISLYPHELEDKRCAPFTLEVRTSWV